MPYTETKADTEPPQNVRQQPNELNAMYRQMIASLDIPREQFDAFSKAVRDGVPVCRLLGIDKETIDKRYALAYQLYTSEK